MSILVTGAAGFIAMHVIEALLKQNHEVIGIDNLNNYYSLTLKKARLQKLQQSKAFCFYRGDLADKAFLDDVFARHKDITHIVHLAAQAGVRHSLEDPFSYVSANILGSVTLLESTRTLHGLRHLVYASSSSVYGLSKALPYREDDPVSCPSSFYGVTKRAGELTAHSFSYLYGLRQTGLRFFTVYGPWGRPDMAVYKFASAICAGKEVPLYRGANLARDFTYIGDVVRGVLDVLWDDSRVELSQIYNIGSGKPVSVRALIEKLSYQLGKEAKIIELERPRSDIEKTWCCGEKIRARYGWQSQTVLDDGIAQFVAWYNAYENR